VDTADNESFGDLSIGQLLSNETKYLDLMGREGDRSQVPSWVREQQRET
jgi:hypothetical protein